MCKVQSMQSYLAYTVVIGKSVKWNKNRFSS